MSASSSADFSTGLESASVSGGLCRPRIRRRISWSSLAGAACVLFSIATRTSRLILVRGHVPPGRGGVDDNRGPRIVCLCPLQLTEYLVRACRFSLRLLVNLPPHFGRSPVDLTPHGHNLAHWNVIVPHPALDGRGRSKNGSRPHRWPESRKCPAHNPGPRRCRF